MGYTHGFKWTKEDVHKEALKYTRRVDFQINSHSAESCARRNGWLDEVCSHMTRLRTKGRTKEECHQVALKYKTYKEFQKFDGAVHLYSKRRMWLGDITSHMKKNTKWEHRKEEVHQVALKYNHRGEFCLKDEKYYEVARRWGWLDDICGHMVSVGHKYMRLVYVYEFDDKSAYIGLTGNDLKRSYSHETLENSPVYRHRQETGTNPIKKIVTDGYIYSEDAKVIEHKTIQKYKSEGWNVLNRAKAGGLGGSDRIWTEEKIMETISKYTHQRELRKNEPKLIHKLQSIGKLNEYLNGLVNDMPTYWNEELVKETISKYTHLIDFRIENPGARAWIGKNKKKYLLEGLINGNERKYVTKRWGNKGEMITIASKYKTISEFQKENGGMYRSAQKLGWLDEIKGLYEPKFLWTREKALEIVQRYEYYTDFRKENKGAYNAIKEYGWNDCLGHLKRTDKRWTIDTAKKEALKYRSRWGFLQGSGGAYYHLKFRGLLDESTTHMEELNVKGRKKETYQCSVCSEVVGGISNLKRWHEGNCNPNRPFSKKNLKKSQQVPVCESNK